MSEFSERITDIMSKRNITQKQLAEMANVTESAMSYYVNGTRTPRIQVLSRLAGVLGVSADYLLGTGQPEAESESPYQYLERNLAKLSPDQMTKAVRILQIVFDDVFDRQEAVSAGKDLCAEADYLYDSDNPAAAEPFILKSFVDITEINETGIFFADGSKIDFKECIRNNKLNGRSRCVAGRNACADPPFMEFLTSGRPTRVLFCSSRSLFFKRQKTHEAIRSMQLQIEAFGYGTADMT